MRTTKPESGNKFYITKAKGGYSTCIQGNPTDKDCNVLANCVGYACGRFNEMIGQMKYPSLNCNAENFIERAKNTYDLEIGQKPKKGAIMVWQHGSLNGSDGAGHVAIVEKVIDDNTVYTSESSYNGKAFFNVTRSNKNGKWGVSENYIFRGFIYNPYISDVKPKYEPGVYYLLVSKTIRRTTELVSSNRCLVKYIDKETKKILTSKNPNDIAMIKEGSFVIINKIITDKTGRIWGKYGNCYIVICNKDGTPQAEFVK